MAVAPATLQQAIDGMYIVMYNRAADSKGYGYWANYAAGTLGSTASTAQFTALANGFYAATPAYFNSQYGALSDIQFVQQLYINMGGNAGDQAGVLFWTSILAGGTSRQTLVGQFVQAFINFDPSNVTGLSAADIAAAQLRQQTFLNKIVVSESYASASATNAFLIPAAASTADPAFVAATNVIQGVTSQDGSVGIAQNQIAAAVTAGNPSPIVGQAIITYLTVGQDVVSNVANVQGDLSAFAYNAIGPTLNSNDILNNVTNFTITDSWGLALDELPAGIQLTNIQNMILNTAGNAGASGLTLFDTTGVTGLKTLTVTSQGKLIDFVKSSATTDVTVNQNSNTGGVDVTGGKNVTVNSAGAIGVLVGNTGLGAALGPFLGVVPNANYLPTGDVTVNVSAPASLGVGILGGKNISVTITGVTNPAGVQIGNTPANTKDSPAGGLTNPTGNITVVDAGPATLGIVAFGGKNVNITAAGGPITVGDVTGVLASNQPTGTVTISDQVLATFNNLGGVAKVSTGYQNVGGIADVVLGNGTPIAANNKVAGGNVIANGGTDVTITVNNGGQVQVGTDSTVTGTLPTGNIKVTNTASDLNGAFGIGGYGVMPGDFIVGGVNVTVQEAGGAVTIGSGAAGGFSVGGLGTVNAADNPTGTVLVTETVASHQVVTVDGANGVTLNLQGQTAVVGANTGTAGAQVVNQRSVFTGNGIGAGSGAVTINGGTTVNVNTTGGNVTVGSTLGGLVNGGTAVPTGAVNIVNTFSGANTAKGALVTVRGGSTVNITQTNGTSGPITVGNAAGPVLNPAGTGLADLALYATGDVTINNAKGTAFTTVQTAGAQTVSITGNFGGFIADVNSFATVPGGTPVGPSKLTTVNLTNAQGAQFIDSNAIANISITNSSAAPGTFATAVTVGTAGGFTPIPAHALNVTLNNAATDEAKAVFATLTDATATSVTIGTAGTAADFIGLTLANTTALSFTNTAAVTLLGPTTFGTNAAITSTGTGALNLGDLAALAGGSVKSVSSTTAAVTAIINGDTTTFAGGSAGGNSVTVESTLGLLNGNPANISAGGTGNTVTVTNVQALYNPLLFPLNPIFNDFTGFQTLGIAGPIDGQPGASGYYNVAGFSGVTVGGAGIAAALKFVGVGAGETLTLTNTAPLPFPTNFWSQKATGGSAVFNMTGTKTAGVVGGTWDTESNQIGPGATASGPTAVTVNSTGGTAASTNTIAFTDATAAKNTITTINFGGSGFTSVTETQSPVKVINASATTGGQSSAWTVITDGTTGATVTGGGALLVADLFWGAAHSVNVTDIVTSGAGGVAVVIGAGNQVAGNTGSETINLGLSGAVRDNLVATPTPGGVVGTNAAVNGFANFVAGNRGAADVLTMNSNDSMFSGTGAIAPGFGAASTIIANTALVGGVSGANYAISNGVFTLLNAPAGFTTVAELADVQGIINAAAINTIGMVQIDQATYVIDSGPSKATTIDDSIIQLGFLTGITGFANATDGKIGLSSGNTVAFTTGNVIFANGGNAGSQFLSKVWNDGGFSAETFGTGFTAAGAAGITNTYNGLGNFTTFTANNTTANAAMDLGNLVINQVGTASELVFNATAGSNNINLDSLTYGGALVINATNAPIAITALVDASNTGTTIWINETAGANAVTIGSISDTALTTINAANTAGAITLGTAGTLLTQAGLTVLGGTGGLTVWASGAGDTITGGNSAAQPGDVVHANGAGDTISLGQGTNFVFANGAGDVITVGNLKNGAAIANAQTIHASGVGDQIIFSGVGADGVATTWTGVSTVDGGSPTTGIGANSTVTFGTNGGGVYSQTVVVTGDLTGATSAGTISFITLNNVAAGANQHVVFGNTTNELFLGQVNVAEATTLAQAFDIAAATAALSQQANGFQTAPGLVPAKTGVIDWFQFGGNTYLVEAINNTVSIQTHTALTATDAVIKITGLVDLSATAGFVAPGNLAL